MKLVPRLCALFLMLALARPVLADESGSFVVRLGDDTTGVESYTRTADRLSVDQVGRAPRTMGRKITYDFKAGTLSHVGGVFGPPGAANPTQTIDATVDGDSLRGQVRTGTAAPQELRVGLPPGALVLFSSSPWAPYETQIMKLARSKTDTLGGVLYFMGGPAATDRYLLRKLGRDSVEITNTHGDVYHAAIDRAGRILGTLPVAGTAKFAITRVASLDVSAFANSFMAREQAGQGVGMLSPRDTVRVASAGGAAITIDYGRPAKRGRVVFGGVVPYGDVWRTGANAATQFRTDKALDFGGTVLPAGFYTLWTLPTAGGWKLIVNSETGQWGTAHKADKDLFSIDMKLSELPQVVERFTISVDATDQGGALNLDWDRTRASAAFIVKP